MYKPQKQNVLSCVTQSNSNFTTFFNQLCSKIQGRNISTGLYIAGQSEKQLGSFSIKISNFHFFLYALSFLKRKKKKEVEVAKNFNLNVS